MSPKERRTYFRLLLGSCFASGFDFLGVLALGYLTTSIALFVIGGSDPTRHISIMGLSIPTANVKLLPAALLIILIFFVSKAILSVLVTRNLAIHLAEVEARASETVVRAIYGVNLDNFRSASREHVLYSATAATAAAFTGILKNMATLTSEGVMFLGVLITFLIVDPVSTVGVVIYFGLIGFLIQFFIGKKLARAARVVAAGSVEATSTINDLGDAFRELYVLGRRDYFFSKLRDARERSAVAIGSQTYLATMPRYIIETAMLLGIFAFGGFKLLSGDIASSVTTIAIFFTGSMRILAAMLPWQGALIEIRRDTPQATIAHGYLGESLSVDGPTQLPKSYIEEQGPLGLEIENLSYSYPTSANEALQSISLSVKPGIHVAIVGASGSGKSTLADIMMGLIQPDAGSILVDGIPPSDIICHASGRIAYMPQSPGLIHGSLSENIALGCNRAEVDLQRLERVTNYVQLSEVVAGLADGLDTYIGNAADALSGGQIQRLGLARALYCEPGLLVIDEGTSALDAETEHEITSTLRELRGKMTIVTIAHRLNTIKDADLIFYMDQGRLVDQGSFGDIVSRNGSLARAVELMSFS